MIKNYEEFLSENLRYGPPFSEEGFVIKAIEKLKQEGFELVVTSSPTQLKNQNLACNISYPGLLDFLKDRYGIEKSNILCNKMKIEELMKALSFQMVIYSRGASMLKKGANDLFKFSSIDSLADNMKKFFAKTFIKGNFGDYRHTPALGVTYIWPDYHWVVIPKTIREERFIVHTQTEDVFDNVPIPQQSTMPDGAKRIMSAYCKDFVSNYNNMEKAFPDHVCKKINTMLCVMSEFLLTNDVPMNFISSPDLGSFGEPKTGGYDKASFSIFYTDTSVRNDKASLKLKYCLGYTDGDYHRRTEYADKLRDIYLRVNSMTNSEREDYLNDLYHRKKGAISGKKYGL